MEALVPGLNIYTWSGVIGQKGVDEELTKITEQIRSYPDNKYLIWGPGSHGLLGMLKNMDYPQAHIKVYYGNG